MQEHIILPSKRRVDVHRIEAPFDQLLQDGEVLVSGECSVVVFSGVDADPEHMLVGEVQVQGTSLYQQIRLGIPGVIYLLTFTATTSEGNLYEVTAKQAVLEDQIPAGPIYTYTYLSTWPYPLESIEGIGVSISFSDGVLWRMPMDGINVQVVPLDGILREILKSTSMPPDGIDVAVVPLDGTIRDILKSYTMQPDGIAVSIAPLDGTIKDVLITYSNYPPEGIVVGITPLGGTLT